MNGRNGTTAFLPLDSKIGGQVSYDRPNVGQFLTREQASYVYKKVEMDEVINVSTIQQEMEQEEQLSKIGDTNREANPYQELIVNNAEKIVTNDTNGTMVNFEQCSELYPTWQTSCNEP